MLTLKTLNYFILKIGDEMRVLAITQARIGSSRLPEKVLKKIKGKTLLEIHIERILQSKLITKLKVATTEEPDASKIEDVCTKLGVETYKGSVDNVLERFYYTAKPENSDWIVRLTSDCPLIDPVQIDKVISFAQNRNLDYASNTLNPTLPDGMDVEVFKFSALEKAYQEASLNSEKEHVTPYIWKNSTYKGGKLFESDNLTNDKDYSSERLTVDNPEDFEVIKKLIDIKGIDKPWIEYVKTLYEQPELRRINEKYKRNEGFQKSINKNSKDNNRTGQKLYKRAKKIIPGGTQLLSKRPELFLPEYWPSYFSKAKGYDVWDLDDNKYHDASYMGIGANTIGYADDEINEAVIKAVKDGNSSTLNSKEELDLAELLIELHPWADMVRYARTGGEAMAIAVRIARAKSRKDKVLFCGYHGWSDWYLAANLAEEDALDGHLIPGLNPLGVPRGLKGTAIPFTYNNTREFLDMVNKHGEETGAIVMESIRGNEPKKEFLEMIRNVATKKKIPLLVDEITAGWRLNLGGAHLIYNLQPDIAVFAKGISNGYPMAAIIGKSQIMDVAQDTFISSTYWTERIGPVAALATIKKMRRENVQQHLKEIGKRVKQIWKEAAEQSGLDIHISGIDPLAHFDFKNDNPLASKTYFTQLMLERGFLASSSFYVSFAHDDCFINEYETAIKDTYGKIKKVLTKGEFEKVIKGRICQTGFKRLA